MLSFPSKMLKISQVCYLGSTETRDLYLNWDKLRVPTVQLMYAAVWFLFLVTYIYEICFKNQQNDFSRKKF